MGWMQETAAGTMDGAWHTVLSLFSFNCNACCSMTMYNRQMATTSTPCGTVGTADLVKAGKEGSRYVLNCTGLKKKPTSFAVRRAAFLGEITQQHFITRVTSPDLTSM